MDGDDAARYNAALERVKKEAIDIFAMARRGTFREARESEILVEFEPGAAAMAQIMEQPRNAERMDRIVSECFGRALHYRPVIKSQQQVKARGVDLGPIYDAFGRENVQVIDEDKPLV